MEETETDSYRLFLTEGPNFREQIAPDYKANRTGNKPWHYKNLTVYMNSVHDAIVCDDGLEADDHMAIAHVREDDTIICSRDKDLRQLPGWSYSWELGRQPRFGPEWIDRDGYLELASNRKTLKGAGLAFFYGQCLVGDKADNIMGCPGVGPVAAYEALNGLMPDVQLERVKKFYRSVYPDNWEEKLTEQGRLLWLIRALDSDASPILWEIGMES